MTDSQTETAKIEIAPPESPAPSVASVPAPELTWREASEQGLPWTEAQLRQWQDEHPGQDFTKSDARQAMLGNWGQVENESVRATMARVSDSRNK